MLFFKKKDDGQGDSDRETRERRQQDRQAQIDALTRGELLPDAIERLTHAIASSDFSSNEFLLARDRGCEPLGVVMGSSFYSVRFGALYGSTWNRTSKELTELTKALHEARRVAVERLRLEAKALGAHGVIGVRLKFKTHDWSAHHIEFTAIGTAVRIDGFADTDHPFTCDLSAQEFWQLYMAGYVPKELVMGICAYYAACDYTTARLLGRYWNGTNQEIDLYTKGVSHARTVAVKRLYEDISRVGAEGAVGMDIDYEFEEKAYESNNTEYIDLLITFVALGTAIVRHKPPPHSREIKPLLCYDLASGNYQQL